MTKVRIKVLVVEDNRPLRASLATLFEGSGHRIDFAEDGITGLRLALEDPPDVMALDLGLPRMDGLTVCKELRAREDRHTPLLMLTSRDALEDKLQGFAAGADDYLVKPFSGEELLARCIALSQRHRLGQHHELRIGDLVVDRGAGKARRGDRELSLNQTPMQILLALAECYPRALTRSDLIERIWGSSPPASDPLRQHLYMLRRELDPPQAQPMLKNLHGVGYRLQVE